MTLNVFLSLPGIVHVASRGRVIDGLKSQDFMLTGQGAHVLTAQSNSTGSLQVDLASNAPHFFSSPAGLQAPHGLATVAADAWQLVRSLAWALFSVTAWLIVFLASRAGAFGSVGRRRTWQQLERIIGMVLLAHLVISAATQISNLEVRIPPESALADAMIHAGLWETVQFPAVTGGVVVLIALTVCLAGSWSRSLEKDGHRLRVWPSWVVSMVGVLITCGAFAGAVWWWQTHTVIADLPALAFEIPVTVLSAMACVAVAAAWLSGSLSRSLAGAYPVHLAKGRAAAGVVTACVAAGLVGLACYVAIVRRASPVSIGSHANGNPVAVSAGFAFAALTVVAMLMLLAAGAASRPWRAPGSHRLASVVVVAAALGVAAPVTIDGGYVPLVLRWGVLLVTGTVMGLAIMRLVAGAVRPNGLSRDQLFVLAPLALLIAVPWGQLRSGATVGWWDVQGYSLAIDGILILVLVVAGVAALRRLGLLPVTTRDDLDGYRALGMAAWFIAFSSSYTLLGVDNVAGVATLAAAALGAWLLLPRDQTRKAAVVLSQSPDLRGQAVDQALRSGAARRVLPITGKTVRDDVAARKTPFSAAQERLDSLESETAEPYREFDEGGRRFRISAQEQGFGMLTSRRPWQRAQWGMLTGAVIGAPWVVLGLAGALRNAGGGGYPELGLAASVAPLVLRWVGYGLLFGYFFPLLRGSAGLHKAVWFFVFAAVPSVLATITAHPTVKQWDRTALLLIQLFAFAMTLGILSEREVLREYRRVTARIVDLHSLWTVSAWASSVAVAVATGIAAVIIAGLQPFVIGVISPAQAPPPATSTPTPTTQSSG